MSFNTSFTPVKYRGYNTLNKLEGVGLCFNLLAYIVPTRHPISNAKAQINQIRGREAPLLPALAKPLKEPGTLLRWQGDKSWSLNLLLGG
jgi:hypothetical protein